MDRPQKNVCASCVEQKGRPSENAAGPVLLLLLCSLLRALLLVVLLAGVRIAGNWAEGNA